MLDVDTGYTIRFTAVDPTTGNVVAGVKISKASIYATLISVGEPPVGPFMLVPGPGA